MYRSTDGAATWSASYLGLDEANWRQTHLDAGSLSIGALGTGLSTFSVRSLALDASRQKLHAGLLRGGVASLALETPERAGPQPTPSERQTRVPPR